MEQIFEHIAIEINNEFSKLSNLVSTDSRGHSRESILTKHLRNLFPDSFGITRGQIIDSKGNRSNEIDIIIYDALKTPILYRAGDYRIIPVEGVYAIIFVETSLTQERLNKLIKTIANIKSFSKTAFYEQRGQIIHKVYAYGKKFDYFPILGMIFAYDSQPVLDLGSLFEKEYEKNGTPIEMQIDLICILNKGLIYHGMKEKPSTILTYPEKENSNTAVSKNENGAINLKNFYLSLNDIMAQATTPPIRLIDYFFNGFDKKENNL